MDFFVHREKHPLADTTSIIVQKDINDPTTIVFHGGLPRERDNVDGWQAYLMYLHCRELQKLEALLGAIPQLLETSLSEDDHSTYLNVLHAVLKFLEEHISQNDPSIASEKYADLPKQLERFLFHFKAEQQFGHYIATFSSAGRKVWEIRISCNTFNNSPVQVSQAILAAGYQQNQEKVRYFIDNYMYFQVNIADADQTTINLFVGLSKALINLIKQDSANLGTYASLTPDICTFIVKNELKDLEAQKTYLEPILNSRESKEKKLERLNGLIKDIKEDIHRRQQDSTLDQQEKDGDRRLIQVIGLISDHYLNLYDLDGSADFWDKAKSKDLILHFFLTLHRRPYVLLFFQLLPLVILFFFAYQHLNTPTSLPTLKTPTSIYPPIMLELLDLRSLAMLACYIPLVILLVATFVQVVRRRWLYSQLLLPRLLGAAVVGLLPLLLNDQSWQIGIQSSLINWFLLSLLTYIGSFVYMFIEVYNTMKFVQNRSVADVLRVSGRIFLIAFSETLFIVTITSTLMFPAVGPSLTGLTGVQFGVYASTPWLSFGFFPALIFLWTGIALFIGSFVQLLWQDKQVTAPV